MYRLMMWFLVVLLGWAVVASATGLLPYDPWAIAAQTVILVAAFRTANEIIARAVGAKQNVESAIITGLILSAVIGPVSLSDEWHWLLIAAAAAIASKYVFAIRKSHIFNPAAFGAVFVGLLGYSASWWIGGAVTLPVVLVGGLLILYKIRRTHLVASFLAVYAILILAPALLSRAEVFVVRGGGFADIPQLLHIIFISSPILFFSFVMLVEPLTSPQARRWRIWFGALIGAVLFIPQWFFSEVSFPLELALLVGNIFARIVSPDFRQAFMLRKKEQLSPDIWGFWFEPVRPFSFIPGQYLEYTLAHPRADARGVRRYFTIASAPEEGRILLATRFAAEKGSTWKKALGEMQEGDEVIASKVAGEFTLPADPKQKVVWIAGGIGVTPYRSMAKHLLEKNERRDIVLLYAARTEPDLVFRDVFESAERIGMRNVYILSDTDRLPTDWKGRTGRLDADMIKAEVPDLTERLFYVSGPEPMVNAISETLQSIGVPERQIRRDYFPGYA